MDCRSIEIFYNVYKNSISTINKLEKKLLGEAYSYGRWFAFLREKSQTIRELYTENEELFSITVGEIIKHPEELDGELADMFLTHIDFFLNEGYRDYGVTVPVLEILIPFYEENGPKERLCDCYYFMGISILEIQKLDEADGWFKRAIDVYPSLNECGQDYRRYRVMCAYFDRLLICRLRDQADQGQLLACYRDAMEVWTKDVPEGFLTEKKADTVAMVIRLVTICAVGTLMAYGTKEVSQELRDIVSDEYERERSSDLPIDSAVYTVYHKLRLINGETEEGGYAAALMERYRAMTGRMGGYRYGSWDFARLFDDELPDRDVDRNKLYYAGASFTFVQYLLPEILEHGTVEMRDEVLEKIYSYYAGMDYISSSGIIDFLIERNLRVYMRYGSDKENLTLFSLNVLVHRQICTAIHSLMVSQLSEMITDHLIESHADELAAMAGLESAGDVRAIWNDWVEYAKLAGMCHDIGKIICSDIINLQARKIQDAEFAVIKRHPGCGARILEESPILGKYADVAHGHHKTYDGKFGYPPDFDNTASPHRMMTDIIAICDSADAATDRLGRNYATAKTFRQVLGELQRDSGTRYNGQIVEMIADDPMLVERIERLTGDDRATVQFQVYKQFVKPDVAFAPKDEKYIRPCRPDDVSRICTISGATSWEQERIYKQCDKYRYIICDGHGTIFGAIFAGSPDGASGSRTGLGVVKDKSIDIVQICVDRRYRRQGCGTMLVEHLVSRAYARGVRSVYIVEDTTAHADKFAWRNGFDHGDRDGYMVKKL